MKVLRKHADIRFRIWLKHLTDKARPVIRQVRVEHLLGEFLQQPLHGTSVGLDGADVQEKVAELLTPELLLEVLPHLSVPLLFMFCNRSHHLGFENVLGRKRKPSGIHHRKNAVRTVEVRR